MDINNIRRLAEGMRETLRSEVAGRLDVVLAQGSSARLERSDSVRLIEKDIKENGRDKVVDRAAYTWFNRLCALRFMDVKGYTTTPVVSPRPNTTQPAILADAAQGVFDPEYNFSAVTKDRITEILTGQIGSANAQEEAYAALLSSVCEHYSKAMPYLFKEEVASSLLMPQGLLSQGSVLNRIVAQLNSSSCESVEVLGWLYQFYISERKDEVFASFKKKKKAQANDIGPATQLFTPNWIVKYLAENSLGRLWLNCMPDSELQSRMKYYVEPGSCNIGTDLGGVSDIKLIDPACGSGHILVYAFDLLYSMYEEEGWLSEDIPAMILQNNLFGIEIDRRAAEIASFALEMKAREKDPSFFDKEIDAHIVVLEKIVLDTSDEALAPNVAKRKRLIESMSHLDEIGSLFLPNDDDVVSIKCDIKNLSGSIDIFSEALLRKLEAMLAYCEILRDKFDVVVANPPYMNLGSLNAWFSSWIKDNYADSKNDLCTCFLERGFFFLKQRGFNSMITMHSWMFLEGYKNMRASVLKHRGVLSLCHLGPHAFDAIGGEVVSTSATVFSNDSNDSQGVYIRLADIESATAKKAALESICSGLSSDRVFVMQKGDFDRIPDKRLSFWLPKNVINAFDEESLSTVGDACKGMGTGDNKAFVREWFEVANTDIFPVFSGQKWAQYRSGGEFRKWAGNDNKIVYWLNNGESIKRAKNSYVRNEKHYFEEGFEWTKISSSQIGARYMTPSYIFDDASCTYYPVDKNDLWLYLAIVNSAEAMVILDALNPTLNFTNGTIGKLPIMPMSNAVKDELSALAKRNVALSEADWDSFERSWGFKRHPLVAQGHSLIRSQYELWSEEVSSRFSELHRNEERINRLLAEPYLMTECVDIDVPAESVTVAVPDELRDIKSLISYGVGCLFGRYSTSTDGLLFAGGSDGFEEAVKGHRPLSFAPDEDNIIPVLDGEYFEDDIVAKFSEWLSDTYGPETLSENISYLKMYSEKIYAAIL